MRKTIVTTSLAALLAVGLFTAASAGAATTVRVDENGDAGWLFNRDASTSSPYQFTTAQSSIGTGSLEVLPIGANPADKFIAEQFLAAPVSSLQSISYDFLIGGNGTATDANDFYLNVYATIDNSDTFYDCRFDYVPTTGSTTAFTTATFSSSSTPTAVTKRGTRIAACPATLSGMPAGSYVRVFAINVGQSNASDTGLGGFLDNVVVAQTGGTTVYDFEASPATKDDCKNGGWQEYGIYRNQGDCVSSVQSNGRGR